jgi:hypothetical protein
MKYGKDFWCIDHATGERLPEPVWPLLQAFRYPDRSRGFWLRRDYTVELIFRGILWRFTIKAGYDTDGASKPRIFWALIGDPLRLEIGIASLIHDILFCVHHPAWPLGLTNLLLLEIIQASGGNWAYRNACHKAVQAGGWACWKKTPEQLAKYRPMLITTSTLPAD